MLQTCSDVLLRVQKRNQQPLLFFLGQTERIVQAAFSLVATVQAFGWPVGDSRSPGPHMHTGTGNDALASSLRVTTVTLLTATVPLKFIGQPLTDFILTGSTVVNQQNKC